MASGATGNDKTDWSGLRNSAAGGRLKLLNVNSAALGAISRSCGDMIQTIMGLADAVGTFQTIDPNLFTAKYISGNQERSTTWLSMQLLCDAFAGKAKNEIVPMLQNHRAVVTDMGYTFTAAAKAYAQNELTSAQAFTPPTTGTSMTVAPPPFTAPINYGNWSTGPSFPTGAGSGVSTDPAAKGLIGGAIENSASLIEPDFANIAAMVVTSAAPIQTLSSDWQWLADQWSRCYTKFVSAVQPSFANWQGEGADTASGFLTTYITACSTLHTAMLDMANVIAHTRQLHYYIWANIPHGEGTFFYGGTNNKSSSVGYNTSTGQWEWKFGGTVTDLTGPRAFWDGTGGKTYKDDINILTGMIPLFPDVNTLAGGTGSGTGPGGGTGGGTGGGSGGGGTGGGGNNGGTGTGGTGSGSGGSSGGASKPSGSSSGSSKPSGGASKSSGGSSNPLGGMPTGSPQSATPPGSSAFNPAALGANPLSAASGPLSKLSNMLQQLASGVPSGASGPWLPSGPLDMFGSGPSGPYGFTMPASSGGGGSSPGGALGPNPMKNPAEDKLFPRAGKGGTGAVTTETVVPRAGIAEAAAMPMGGMPMGGMPMGGMGGAQAGQQKERKRASYLDGKEHLEEAVGEDPLSVRPIIDR
ncbi:hypothetical protein ABZ942_40675 [Nocardia sp. NPDC046473]|uniref:hypothetical protein n=1 Tax=Nocardia sp. NPDC046473 TaxID=3155733 RepID=UPI0033F82529